MTNIDTMKLALDKVADAHRLLRQAISVSEEHERQREAAGKWRDGYTQQAISEAEQVEQTKMKECRHCGWLCTPNNEKSKKWYPLEQAEHIANTGKMVEIAEQEPVIFDKWDVDEAKRLLPEIRRGVALLEYIAGVLPRR